MHLQLPRTSTPVRQFACPEKKLLSRLVNKYFGMLIRSDKLMTRVTKGALDLGRTNGLGDLVDALARVLCTSNLTAFKLLGPDRCITNKLEQPLKRAAATCMVLEHCWRPHCSAGSRLHFAQCWPGPQHHRGMIRGSRRPWWAPGVAVMAAWTVPKCPHPLPSGSARYAQTSLPIIRHIWNRGRIADRSFDKGMPSARKPCVQAPAKGATTVPRTSLVPN